MNKKDVQALYNEVKRQRKTGLKTTKSSNAKKSGCKSCGKVTWKPDKQKGQ